MKYRLLKNLPGIISGTIILEGSKLLEILDTSDREWFEPVNERIELSYGQTWLQSGWAISKKDGSEWTDEQQEKVIAALNNELYSEEEIREAYLSWHLNPPEAYANNFIGHLKKQK